MHEKLTLNRREALRLGRSALLIVGASSLIPMTQYLSARDVDSQTLYVEKSASTLNPIWQRIHQSRFYLRQGAHGLEGIWATCTHLGCEVRFDPDAEQWICPCHGSKYSSEGKPTQGPAITALAQVTVLDDGRGYRLTPST